MARNKGGRPTIMDENTVNKLEEAFANGATDIQACFYADISKQTLYNYQDKHPEFIDRKEGLKNHLQLIAKNVLAKSVKNGSELDSKWLLERKEKETYSIKTESKQELTGDLKVTGIDIAIIKSTDTDT